MDEETLMALGDHLKKSITLSEAAPVGRLLPQFYRTEGCDHTLGGTTRWLESNGRDFNKELRWLKARGGDCDCKVITNVVMRMDAEI